ncbi:hypothetical protein BO70DRAFT_122243, partial [Aspergillus heteromorphus CBS 117.55]
MRNQRAPTHPRGPGKEEERATTTLHHLPLHTMPPSQRPPHFYTATATANPPTSPPSTHTQYTILLRHSNRPGSGKKNPRPARGEPQLRKAEVFGYTIAKWGDYPALINGKQGDVVTGSAYLVRSEEEARKLADYETNAYEVVDCWIYFKDGRR